MISILNDNQTIEQLECKISRMFKRGYAVVKIEYKDNQIKLHWGIIKGSTADIQQKRSEKERGIYGF